MDFFAVETDQFTVLHDFGVAMGDFLVEDDVVFGEGTFVALGLGADFVGSLESVVETFVDFLDMSKYVHPRVF
jgi:hypothetical protein